MDIAVSGSHGLIASSLIPVLRSAGHNVRRLVRPDSGASGSDPSDIAWDPDAGVLDPDALEGVGAVINLAGAGIGDEKWSPERKKIVIESRTRSTTLLAETLAERGDATVVFLSGSAIGFYGNRPDEVCTEESASGAGFLPEVCRAWEEAAAPAVDAGLRVAFLRTGIVLDPSGGALKPLLLPFRLGLGGKAGTGRQGFSWVHVEDEVGGIVKILDDASLSGPVNLTAPNPLTYGEFAHALGAALHRPTLLPTPTFAISAKLGKEAAREMVLEGVKVLPAKLTAAGYRFHYPEIGPALADLLG